MKKEFESIGYRAAHNIEEFEDDIKQCVNDFHSKKHIFIYNKDLSKGYFLKIDPNHVNSIAKRLHTFKFKEPRVHADEGDEERKRLLKQQEKFFEKRGSHAAGGH